MVVESARMEISNVEATIENREDHWNGPRRQGRLTEKGAKSAVRGTEQHSAGISHSVTIPCWKRGGLRCFNKLTWAAVSLNSVLDLYRLFF